MKCECDIAQIPYESPYIRSVIIEPESFICSSNIEELEEIEGDWGW